MRGHQKCLLQRHERVKGQLVNIKVDLTTQQALLPDTAVDLTTTDRATFMDLTMEGFSRRESQHHLD